MKNELFKLAQLAKEKIKKLPKKTVIRVISHYDADGITSAAIICKSLYREGYKFHVTLMKNPFKKGLERLKRENGKMAIFCDMGSGQIDRIAKLDYESIIICDHHQPMKDAEKDNRIIEINAHLCGINGSFEASGSTITFAVAINLDEKNFDLLPLAMTGAVGDKQHLGGFKGYNKELFELGLKNKLIEVKREWFGSRNKISEHLYYSIEPYYKGLSGRKDEIEKFLKKLGINDNLFDELDNKKKMILRSSLVLQLIKNGCTLETIDNILAPKYFSQSLDRNLDDFAELLDACGKSGEKGLGLLIALDNKNLIEKAENIRKKFKKRVLEGLIKLEKSENIFELDALQYFFADDPSLGGIIGGIAINYFLRNDKPILSLTEMDDELHISARGNQLLVEKGLDLGLAMREGAKMAGGIGGGHNIAAGATIPKKEKNLFLQKVDEIVKEQLI